MIESFRHAFGVTCEMAIVIANVFGFAFLIILVLGLLVLIKYRWDQKDQEAFNFENAPLIIG